MKKYLIAALIAVCSITLISWGYVGHQTVGIIAENHLSPQARQVVKALLGSQSLGDVASWADEIRDDKTFPEHFINAPLGLNYQQFQSEVKNQPQDNVFKAMLANEAILTNLATSNEEKAKALKFIVHFVGDLHQPMHVSRKEDKGGNTIQLQFEGKGTNLHSLWDSKLIDRQGFSAAGIAQKFDHATPAQIKEWQSGDLMQWLWESYQISSKLYPEIEKNNKLDEVYYNSHIGIVDERIEKAGIRLAGVLNTLFENLKIAKQPSGNDELSEKLAEKATKEVINVIDINDAAKSIGMTVSTSARVYGTRDLGSFVLVNLGGAYPNQLLTVLLRGEAKALAQTIGDQTITVTGRVIDYKGKPEIVVTDKNQIMVTPVVGKGRE